MADKNEPAAAGMDAQGHGPVSRCREPLARRAVLHGGPAADEQIGWGQLGMFERVALRICRLLVRRSPLLAPRCISRSGSRYELIGVIGATAHYICSSTVNDETLLVELPELGELAELAARELGLDQADQEAPDLDTAQLAGRAGRYRLPSLWLVGLLAVAVLAACAVGLLAVVPWLEETSPLAADGVLLAIYGPLTGRYLALRLGNNTWRHWRPGRRILEAVIAGLAGFTTAASAIGLVRLLLP